LLWIASVYFVRPCKGTAESSFVTDGNRSIQNIDLITCNIEGAKSNNVFLQKVAKEKSVLCIQPGYLVEVESLAFGCSGLPVYISSGPVVFGVERFC
jgi:hypothetical protein